MTERRTVIGTVKGIGRQIAKEVEASVAAEVPLKVILITETMIVMIIHRTELEAEADTTGLEHGAWCLGAVKILTDGLDILPGIKEEGKVEIEGLAGRMRTGSETHIAGETTDKRE